MPLDGEWSDAYDVVIVGSGFGGSVMAAELAAGWPTPWRQPSVCVLERGKAYPPGAFPRDVAGVRKNFWTPGNNLHGLYDVTSFDHIDAVVASGLGGGSLIYANVMLRKDASWFQQRSPNGEFTEQWALRRDDLDEHYDEVVNFLGVEELPHDIGDIKVPEEFHLAKTTRFLSSAGANGRHAPLAIRFRGKDGQPAVGTTLPAEEYGNIHGSVIRRTCCLNGECDVGCNEGAKSSLDHTYLSRASRDGAHIHTLTEVLGLRLANPDENGRFVLTVKDHRDDRADLRHIWAERVVVAAGTLGSTKLLLRNECGLGLSRPDGQTTSALGSRFCGNGDFLGAVRGADDDLDCWRGPVITAYRRYPAESDPAEIDSDQSGAGDGADVNLHGMFIEDAGFPNFRNWNPQWAAIGFTDEQFADVWGGHYVEGVRQETDFQAGLDVEMLRATWDSPAGWNPLSKFMPLLGMGRDRPDGRLSLAQDGRLQCDWSVDSSEAYFTTMNERMRIIAEELGGQYVPNPLYHLLNRVITVHPVGGCPMDTNLHEGVLDTYGRVRGVPGLRVCDGSVFPGPIGPNPSLTIAAFARRSAHNLLDEQYFAGPPTEADAYEGS